MTKRYYYNCPIKAAYMSEYFGVKFLQLLYPTIHHTQRELCNVSFENIIEEIGLQKNVSEKTKYENRLIVAPESEHIFEKKESDKGVERNLHSQDICHFGGKYWHYENEELRTVPNQLRVEIIYRNGKQFFMPEVESAL